MAAAAVGRRDMAGGWRRPRPTSAPRGGALGVPPPHPGRQPGPALRFCPGGGHSGPPSPGTDLAHWPLQPHLSLLEGSGLTLRPRQPPAVLRGPGHTWAPRPPANSSEHREGCRHRLTHTKEEPGPRRQEGDTGARGQGHTPGPSAGPRHGRRGCLRGPPSFGRRAEAAARVLSLTAAGRAAGPGAQLLRAMVSTTCSSLPRSRCRRACSSFSRAVRICRGREAPQAGSGATPGALGQSLRDLGLEPGPPGPQGLLTPFP